MKPEWITAVSAQLKHGGSESIQYRDRTVCTCNPQNLHIRNVTLAKRYSRPAHCCRCSYKARCLHMHINAPIHIFMHTHISEWHRHCTCTYTRTHAHVHIYSRLYQPRHCRLYQPPTTGCISPQPALPAPTRSVVLYWFTTGWISPVMHA